MYSSSSTKVIIAPRIRQVAEERKSDIYTKAGTNFPMLHSTKSIKIDNHSGIILVIQHKIVNVNKKDTLYVA